MTARIIARKWHNCFCYTFKKMLFLILIDIRFVEKFKTAKHKPFCNMTILKH